MYGATMDAGRLGYLTKVADPVSRLVVLRAPAAVKAMPVPRPRLTVPSDTPVFPANCSGTVEIAGVQPAPPGSIEMVARLLTAVPACTTTGMKHPTTPFGIVKRITSQAAMPCGIG